MVFAEVDQNKSFLFVLFRIIKMQAASLMDKWKSMHWPQQRLCEGQTVRAISLADVQGLFYTFAFGLILAVLCNIFEHLSTCSVPECKTGCARLTTKTMWRKSARNYSFDKWIHPAVFSEIIDHKVSSLACKFVHSAGQMFWWMLSWHQEKWKFDTFLSSLGHESTLNIFCHDS